MRNEVAKIDLTLSFYRDSTENFILPSKPKFSQEINIAYDNSNYGKIQNSKIQQAHFNKHLEIQKYTPKGKLQTNIIRDKEDINQNAIESKEEGEVEIHRDLEKVSINQRKQLHSEMNGPIFSESKPKKEKSFEKSGKAKNLHIPKEQNLMQKPELKL